MIVYSVTDPNSFKNVPNFFTQILRVKDRWVPTIVPFFAFSISSVERPSSTARRNFSFIYRFFRQRRVSDTAGCQQGGSDAFAQSVRERRTRHGGPIEFAIHGNQCQRPTTKHRRRFSRGMQSSDEFSSNENYPIIRRNAVFWYVFQVVRIIRNHPKESSEDRRRRRPKCLIM